MDDPGTCSYLSLGKPEEASDLVGAAFEYMSGDGYHEGIASCGQVIAVIDALKGNHERAARILGACSAIFERIGVVPWFEAEVHVESATTAIEESLGREEFGRLYAEGSSYNVAQAEDLAFEAMADQYQTGTVA